MAISTAEYTDLFEDIGKIIKNINIIINKGTTVATLTGATTSGAGAAGLTDTTSPFTASMVGMTIDMTGGTNVAVGRYTIIGFTNVNNVTLDRAPDSGGAVASGAGKIKSDWLTDMDGTFIRLSEEYTTNSHDDLVEGVQSLLNSVKDSAVGQALTLANLCTLRLQHKETILDKFPQISGNTSIAVIAKELRREMIDDSKTIEESVLSIGTVSEDKINANAGTILYTAKLSGDDTPRAGAAIMTDYAGVLSELAYPNDIITLTCTSDSESSGTTEGSEVFSVNGLKSKNSAWGWDGEGSGMGGTIKPTQSGTLLSNMDFETWANGDPSSWSFVTGASENFVEETTHIHHGDSALKIVNGTVSTVRLTQAITSTSLKPYKTYCFTAWIKTASVTGGGSNLLIQLEDDTPAQVGGSTEKITLNLAALQALSSYTLHNFFIQMPAEIPDTIRLAFFATVTGSIYIDWVGFAPVTYWGGIGIAPVAGTQKFLVSDRFQTTLTYSATGTFQDFFREYYAMQLPSASSPSFADSLAL